MLLSTGSFWHNNSALCVHSVLLQNNSLICALTYSISFLTSSVCKTIYPLKMCSSKLDTTQLLWCSYKCSIICFLLENKTSLIAFQSVTITLIFEGHGINNVLCLLSIPGSGWMVGKLLWLMCVVYMKDTAQGHMTSALRLCRGCENKHAGVLEIRGVKHLPPLRHTHTWSHAEFIHIPRGGLIDSHAPGPVSTLNAISQPHIRQHGK